MSKVIIINANNSFIDSTEQVSRLMNQLLEKGYKIIIVNKENTNSFIVKDEIPFKNLSNLIEIDYNAVLECYPATCMTVVHNYGVNLNYPSTIIDCVEKMFSYEDNFKYTYITFDNNHKNRYAPLLNDYFEKNGFTLRKVTDAESLERELGNILNYSDNNFYKISMKSEIPEFPSYEEILFSDRSGTIEDYSLFFDKLAPFEKNMDELIELLKNDRFLLCGISSGDHQEGFLSRNILRRLQESGISTDNILAFDQYRMAKMIKNGRTQQSNKIIMGFGDFTKEECIRQFLKFLEPSKKLPKKMYAIGDHPLDDIPMLKLIHSQGGEVGFISPYTDKGKIIQAIRDTWLIGSWEDKEAYEYRLLREKQYYQMIQNVDENWDWIRPNIYKEAKAFLKQIRK